jgi:hypothetical protein
MRLWIDVAIESGADTIFWDEPHFYIPYWDDLNFAPENSFACFCPRCCDAFRTRFGQPLSDNLTVETRLHREDLMVDFLTEMVGYASDKGAKNAITLLPVESEANESLPWQRIADLRGLDIFGTDPYWFLYGKDCADYVSGQLKRVMGICAPRKLMPHFWAQGFGIPAGRESELETGFRLAVEMGAQSVAIWGMHGNTALDGASENPVLVWETVGKTFRRLRKNEQYPILA